MINRVRLLRNIGHFDSVDQAQAIPLHRLVLIYAENGRGKTTLTAILRSLAKGDPIPIVERKRLGAQHAPHVILECDGGPPAAIFQNGAWNRTLPGMPVFDDGFVVQNVYSGLEVDSAHRQSLHEVILGSQGIALASRLKTLADAITDHNQKLRTKGDAIPAAARGSLTLDQFCDLQARDDVDVAIQAAEQAAAAMNQQAAIRDTPELPSVELPQFATEELRMLFAQTLETLDETVIATLNDHFDALGEGGESWVSAGMQRGKLLGEDDDVSALACPFCAQSLDASDLIKHYRVYFGQAYANLKRRVQQAMQTLNEGHGADAVLQFERDCRLQRDRHEFWSRFCPLPALTIRPEDVTRLREVVATVFRRFLENKQARPLDFLGLTHDDTEAIAQFEVARLDVGAQNLVIEQNNRLIRDVKQRAAIGDAEMAQRDLNRLRATRARHTPTIAAACQAYLEEKNAKAETELLKAAARTALDDHRTQVFPRFQEGINQYLRTFNAGFTIDRVAAANPQGQPSCTYQLVINGIFVPVAGGNPAAGMPAFKNTLSAGDRNTLALAFFFASIDMDPDRATKTIVIDDPISSLDDHRSLATAQQIRALAERTAQVIVLAHDKRLLCQLWEHADKAQCTALHIARDAVGSTIAEWDVCADSVTDYDRHHSHLRQYRQANVGDRRQIARMLRPLLEGFLRRACAEHFHPGENLGMFRRRLRGLPANAALSAVSIGELDAVAEYSNRFHHDTNPAYMEGADVNDAELCGFIDRTLAFVRK